MKIRSYKGKSLGAIYEAINRELGPGAVVIQPEKGGKGVAGLFNAGSHELVAVVDDGSSDSHYLNNVAKSDEILKEINNQRRRQKELERLMRDLRDEVSGLADARGSALTGSAARPDHAAGWDDAFLLRVSCEVPEALDEVQAEETAGRLAHIFNAGEPVLRKSSAGPRIVVLTGPTGSGKTTTMAKLAAQLCLEKKMNVGLITADTYRVAAVEQTREYAGLLGLELKVVFSSEEMRRAVERYSDKDVILVDTPGRSHLDTAALGGLKGMMEGIGQVVNLVLVPAGTRRSDVVDILESFGGIASTNYLVVTKLDETREFSVFTTLATCCKWPVAYVTDGQRVPSDIHAADSMRIAQMVLFGRSSRQVWE